SINPIIARLVLVSPSPGNPGEGRGEGSPTWLAKNPHPALSRSTGRGEAADAGLPKSIAEIAERYAAALATFDNANAYPDPSIEELRQVLRGDDSPVNVALADAQHLFGNVDRMKRRGLKAKIDELTATHPGSPQRAMAVEDVETPIAPHVLKRGHPANPGPQAPRPFPASLRAGDAG